MPEHGHTTVWDSDLNMGRPVGRWPWLQRLHRRMISGMACRWREPMQLPDGPWDGAREQLRLSFDDSARERAIARIGHAPALSLYSAILD